MGGSRVGGGGRGELVDFLAEDGEGRPAVHGPGAAGMGWVSWIYLGEGWEGEGGAYAPQSAMSVVAKPKDSDNGARIIDAANAIWETPHAVAMSIWYRRVR